MAQWEIARDALEAGEHLTMISMLQDYGIGNHTNVISLVRKHYEKIGLGYDRVKMRYVHFKSKKTGRPGRFAVYYIEK